MLSTSSSGPADLRVRRAVLAAVALAVVAFVGGVTTWVVVDSSNDKVSTSRSNGPGCEVQLPTGSGAATIGRPSPAFVLRALDGSCVDLASYRGRPIVVNFWASWCNPCRDEFPMFRASRAKYADGGLEILGVIHDDIAGDARRFARQQDAAWPLLLDPTGAVADAYGVTSIPQTFFVERDGTVRAHLFGLSERDFNAEVKRILADDR